MKLLTESHRRQLRANAAPDCTDPEPVVKFFNPLGSAKWLFTRLDEDGDTLFGLADIGHPELGYASLAEIAALDVGLGLGIERDLLFRARAPLSVYAAAARSAGRIVEFGPEFDQALNLYQAAARRDRPPADSSPGR